MIGIDIIEVDRIKKSIESLGNKFLERVYTQKEIEYCESKKQNKYQHYAARFAAKEAVFKSISEILEDKFDIGFKDIEILNDNKGKPFVKISNVNIDEYNVNISLSHIKEYAVATAIMIKKD